jgi:hypothetical protein
VRDPAGKVALERDEYRARGHDRQSAAKSSAPSF